MNAHDVAVLIQELYQLADGRSIEVHIKPKHPIDWFRASVLIAADERDAVVGGVAAHVAFGFGTTLDAALRKAISDFKQHSPRDQLQFPRAAAIDRARQTPETMPSPRIPRSRTYPRCTEQR
ncbi:hypothetical protein [Nevskia sp.]|uniref:hypothetical protein n=1 Tax=Nevskia sp. TaxID=1929292 RepID=UPI0025E9B19B|nr:hypothetical protein [Nevskia sp.]